jgi:hypothetical protein
MVTELRNTILKTPEGSVVGAGFDGYCSTDGTGWFLLTGLAEDFPLLRPWSKYVLESDGATTPIFTGEVTHTLMVTTHHLSVEFKAVRPDRAAQVPNSPAAR